MANSSTAESNCIISCMYIEIQNGILMIEFGMVSADVWVDA